MDSIATLLLVASLLQATAPPPAAPAGEPLPAATTPTPAPAPQKIRRLVEPHSGVEFKLDARWKSASGAGMTFLLDGNATLGALSVQFPVHFEKPPATVEEFRALDRAAARERATGKVREVELAADSPPAIPSVIPALSIEQDAVRIRREGTTFLERTWYLKTAEAQIISVRCRLSEAARTESGDPCADFVASAALMAPEKRAHMIAALDMRSRQLAQVDDQKVPCRQVTADIAEWRSYYPESKLTEVPRLQILYVAMIAKVFETKNSQAGLEGLRLTNEFIGKLVRVCEDHPEISYEDAVGAIK
jgi:hypothetical protein